jgi:hypothetical protein
MPASQSDASRGVARAPVFQPEKELDIGSEPENPVS